MREAERVWLRPSIVERTDQLVSAQPRDQRRVVVLAGGLNALITRPCNNVDPRDGSEPTPEEDEYQQDRAHL